MLNDRDMGTLRSDVVIQRTNVIRMAMAYLVASGLVMQVAKTMLPAFGFGDNTLRFVIVLATEAEAKLSVQPAQLHMLESTGQHAVPADR